MNDFKKVLNIHRKINLLFSFDHDFLNLPRISISSIIQI